MLQQPAADKEADGPNDITKPDSSENKEVRVNFESEQSPHREIKEERKSQKKRKEIIGRFNEDTFQQVENNIEDSS